MTAPGAPIPPTPPARKFGEYAVAGTAFFVSVCSLFIYVYQSKVMTEQQQVSVWPHVQWSSSDQDAYQIIAVNKGVGPAIVKKMHWSFNGKVVDSHRGLVMAVRDPSIDMQWQSSDLEGTVMSPGEKVTLIAIADPVHRRDFKGRLDAGKFTLEITYCSIYGRCWTSSGAAAKRAPDDDSIDY